MEIILIMILTRRWRVILVATTRLNLTILIMRPLSIILLTQAPILTLPRLIPQGMRPRFMIILIPTPMILLLNLILLTQAFMILAIPQLIFQGMIMLIPRVLLSLLILFGVATVVSGRRLIMISMRIQSLVWLAVHFRPINKIYPMALLIIMVLTAILAIQKTTLVMAVK